MIYLFVQGRGIETNLYAQFKCDSLKIGMVMHLSIILLLSDYNENFSSN